MLARLSAFVIWGLVAATAVFWGLRLLVRPSAPPSYAVAVVDSSAMRGDLTRVLGSAPVAAPVALSSPEASARFRLLGIMAPKPQTDASSAQGLALIAVDGNMPKAYAVGASVDGDLVLQAVSLRTASIGQAHGTPSIRLELPPPVPPATGTLPGINAGAGGAPAFVPGRPGISQPTTPQITPQTTPQFVPQYVPQPVAQPVPLPPGQMHQDENAPAQ